MVPVVFTVVALIFSMAWWTSLRGKPSARSWGIAASIINILVALFPVILSLKFNHDWLGLFVGLVPIGLVLALGISGLVVFARPSAVLNTSDEENQVARVRCDGTFGWLNQLAGLLGFALAYGAYSWWLRWARVHDLWAGWNFLWENVIFFGILAIIVVVHEFGHAAAGLAFGMKLRMFAVGPLQWSRVKCKWRFEFTRKMLARRDGAVGLLPVSSTCPPWHGAFIAAAGPAANIATGVIALFTAFTLPPDEVLQLHGRLALFGALSLSIAIGNLIPFRVGEYYSDGARCYQHLTNHPLCDFRQVIQAVMAVSETSMRPRDYSIGAIDRSLGLYPLGMQGHYLKLYVYDHYFDSGLITEACRALKEAEAIYDASSLKTETEISFVLGYSSLCKDATAARRWWERLEARNAPRSDAGYWLSKCAFDCVEGRWEDGQAALRHADAFIAEMPLTGDRAVDGDWSRRLHSTLESAGKVAPAIYL
jgi:hypothetical protein